MVSVIDIEAVDYTTLIDIVSVDSSLVQTVGLLCTSPHYQKIEINWQGATTVNEIYVNNTQYLLLS